jgi:D-arabinose 1-dehydrogenase-like Zn-dependent alcohol dehydrogenase
MGGADVVIAVAVVPAAFEQAYRSLKPGWTLVFVALPADNFMQLSIFETVLHGITSSARRWGPWSTSPRRSSSTPEAAPHRT